MKCAHVCSPSAFPAFVWQGLGLAKRLIEVAFFCKRIAKSMFSCYNVCTKENRMAHRRKSWRRKRGKGREDIGLKKADKQKESESNRMEKDYAGLLRRMVKKSEEIFEDNLTGIYLHGSAAMGCFQAQKSDLDLIFVVERDIPYAVKLKFMEHVAEWNGEAPAKGIEFSIVKRQFCNPFAYPTPFELHFSQAHLRWYQENPWDYVDRMKGVDRDLAAHFTIIGRYGIVLYGKPVPEVFGPVPQEDYIDSIVSDIENAEENILEDPVYVILNLCRVLAYLRGGKGDGETPSAEQIVLSKKGGGEWGLEHLPERFRGLIEAALSCYRDGTEMAAQAAEEECFADYMLTEIRKNRGERAEA